MPLPLILGGVAAAAAAVGAGSAVRGGVKMKKAHDGPVDKVLTTDVFYVIIGKTDKGWGLCS